MTDSLRSEVLNRISQRDWLSDERRKYLERLGTLTAGSKVRVKFANIPTASCGYKDALGYHEIRMRNHKIDTSSLPQSFKDLGGDMIHTLTQEGFLYHELGHVLMSDYDAWEKTVEAEGSLKRKKMFKQFLNATEDVVIEAWLREKYDCGKILDFKNEVKFRGITGVPEEQTESFYDKTIHEKFQFVLNLVESVGRYDGDFLEWAERTHGAWMSDYEQPIREMVSKVVREPDAGKRYRIIARTFDNIYDDFSRDNPADEDHFSPENEMGGDQEMRVEMVPIPAPEGDKEEDEDEGGDGSGGDDSGNTSEEQDGNGSGGSSVNREARPVEKILKGRDPEEVKVVM